MPIKRSLLCATLCFSLTGHVAKAAETPDSGQLLNEQQQQQMQLPQSLPEAEPPPLSPPSDMQTGPRVYVRDFRFTGAGNIASEEELQELAAPFRNKELDFAQLQAVAEKVSTYLKDKGWPLARAYLPKQDVTQGHIEIAILQGRVESRGATIVAEDTRLPADTIKNIMDEALPDDQATPSQEDLERGVLLIDDMPGMSAHSTLERGNEAGTTRVVVEAKEGPLVTGNLGASNYGNRYTGRWQLDPGVNINDPLGWGDQLTASGTASTTGGLGMYQFGYSLPVGDSGLRASASFSHLAYALDPALAGVKADGTAQTMTARMSYPIERTRAMSVWTGAQFTHKDLRDEVSDATISNREMNNGMIDVTATTSDNFAGGGMMTMTLAGTAGDLDRSGLPSDLQTDSTTAQTNGVFLKATASFARLQHLFGDFSLFGAVRGQISNKNLDFSEKFILGGPSGIRAYPIGEATGDEGWVSNIELRYDVPADLTIGRLQLIAFSDFGTIWLNHNRWDNAIDNAGNTNSFSLAGAGLGANLTLSTIYALRASWARTLGSNPGRSTMGYNADGHIHNNEFWFQAVAQF